MSNIKITLLCMILSACGDNLGPSVCYPNGDEKSDDICVEWYGKQAISYSCDIGADLQHPISGYGYDNCYTGDLDNGDTLICCLPEK